jgi:hypothetical protein
MEKIKAMFRSEGFFVSALLFIVAGLLYLPFISRFGYFNDDWYLMYAAGAKGPMVFKTIFAIDRPLRALVMIPAYYLFGPNPLYYNLSAFFFRFLSGLFFLWTLRMVWPNQRWMTLSAALLFLAYPGFLSQPNAIDYQSHLSGLAAGMLSIGLTVKALQTEKGKTALYIFSILLGWFYLSQIEWYIGLEFFRFGCVFVVAINLRGLKGLGGLETLRRFLRWAYLFILVPAVFLAWRVFIFKSERGATDINLQFGDVLSSPGTFLLNWMRTLGDDSLDVLFRAWLVPLQRLGSGISTVTWMVGFGIAALILAAVWVTLSRISKLGCGDLAGGPVVNRASGRGEIFWLGLGLVVCGLLPVILVGRYVDFANYSRYTLIASAGVALLWALGFSLIPNTKLRTALLSVLLLSAALTHYANALMHVRSTEIVNNFWWQVSWRIPQLEPGTTLVTRYPVTAEEDYFVWGPANLIYRTQSAHKNYVQPAIYAALLNSDTVASVQTKQPQDFSNRRGIRTYKNYRNILIISKPTPASCVQVIDGNQIELSSGEDSRVKAIASFSDISRIVIDKSFQTPPAIPFGAQPSHDWCYYYQKASYARQLGDLDEVARLGNEARSLGLSAGDPIEWMPFLQADAHFDDIAGLNGLAPSLTSDPVLAKQACHTLTAMPLSAPTMEQVKQIFCR